MFINLINLIRFDHGSILCIFSFPLQWPLLTLKVLLQRKLHRNKILQPLPFECFKTFETGADGERFSCSWILQNESLLAHRNDSSFQTKLHRNDDDPGKDVLEKKNLSLFLKIGNTDKQ